MAVAPGLEVTVERGATAATPLRTDVAGFVGRLARGPIGQAIEVRDWGEFAKTFGGSELNRTSLAVRGYFANGGELAYVVRLSGRGATTATAAIDARTWVEATSPGAWANGIDIELSARPGPLPGTFTYQVVVDTSDARYRAGGPLPEASELALGPGLVLRQSPAASGEDGLRSWFSTLVDADMTAIRCRTAGGSDGRAASGLDLLGATQALLDQPDVAIIALPDLWDVLAADDPADPTPTEVLATVITACDDLLDRLVLVDWPAHWAADQVRSETERLRGLLPRPTAARSAAAYHPWLRIEDRRVGTQRRPLLVDAPPCGHVAGMISRVDRQEGPSRSPANVLLDDVVDLVGASNEGAAAMLRSAGVNPIRCVPGRGLQVWGARTLAQAPNQFLGQRRLTHRLVRAMRRAAEPLVFEPNATPLRLAIVRALTSVLLAAYRTGALRGRTPAEAFTVRCDETTMSNQDVEDGRLVCEVSFAPARPMERIVVRVLLSADGRFEVVEQ
jgi:phage tail sheath protein FI